MVMRVVIDFGELVKVALKKGRAGKGVGGLRGMGAAWFCGPCMCFGVFLLLECMGVCVKDCRGLELCTVGTVG
jgi:hypothetical protein